MPTVRARKMFGEYVVLQMTRSSDWCDEQVFIKITPEGRAWSGIGTKRVFLPGAKP